MIDVCVDDKGVVLSTGEKGYRVRFDTKRVERCGARCGGDSVHGVVGILPDLGDGLLVTITAQDKVDTINGMDVWRVRSVGVIPLRPLSNNNNNEVQTEEEEGQQEETVIEDVMLRRRRTLSVSNRPAYTNPGMVNHATRFVKQLFGNGFFYHSEYDLSNSAHNQSDPVRIQYVFNHSMARELHHTGIVTSLVQGFVRSVELEGEARLTLISRRSTHRAGFRYLRRGVDSQGNCANWVETEQVLQVNNHTASFVILRGSMPVFFTQSSFSLHPTPKLQRRKVDHTEAFDRHFARLHDEYGPNVLAVSLVEMPPSKESAVGAMYADIAYDKEVPLEWFDFHQVCSGMRFDRVVTLFDDTEVGDKLVEYGWSDQAQTQQGVLRVNCVDCLDRTNVVQASCAQRVLSAQLAKYNVEIEDLPQNVLFNSLWADNGDAVSMQYAGTSALKGDYTRTQRRGYAGVLTDAFLSLTRTYQGMVPDFFNQACLDYLLGNCGATEVFGEYELRWSNTDPSLLSEKQKRKLDAVQVCCVMVIQSESEVLMGTWWTVDEKLVIVTNTAVYHCSYDLENEKVMDYVRIETWYVHTAVLSKDTRVIKLIGEQKDLSAKLWSDDQFDAMAKTVKSVCQRVEVDNNRLETPAVTTTGWTVLGSLKRTIWG